MEKAEVVAVSRIAWAEFHAALARRQREVPADAAPVEEAANRLKADWPDYFVLEVSQPVLDKAGGFASVFALRAYDAVQLASAARMHEQAEQQMRFACFDKRLNQAAEVLGMQILMS